MVEIVIYVALFTVFSVVFISSLVVMTRTFLRIRSNNYISDSGYAGMERMSREIRGATSADTSVSGALTLTNSNGTLKFDVSGGALRLTENSVVTGNLTGGNVTVSSLVFSSISTTQGTAVKVALTLQDNHTTTHTENFYDTVILRGAY